MELPIAIQRDRTFAEAFDVQRRRRRGCARNQGEREKEKDKGGNNLPCEKCLNMIPE